MLELKTKGVEELAKVKNRVARLYGLGRISNASFTSLHAKLVILEEELKEADERDDSGQQGSSPTTED